MIWKQYGHEWRACGAKAAYYARHDPHKKLWRKAWQLWESTGAPSRFLEFYWTARGAKRAADIHNDAKRAKLGLHQ